jgi:hypothetical protein
MLQTAFAAGGVMLALGKDSLVGDSKWLWAAIAGIFLALGAAMLRIGFGINQNNKILKTVGSEIGDSQIPHRENWYTGVSTWIAFGVILIGLISTYFFIKG